MEQKLFQIKAQGNSMYPILRDGDVIEYVKVPFGEIKLNDIVLIYEKGTLVTHRVIYKTKTSCITRGDNNIQADSMIQKGKILAKVIRFRRNNKWYSIQDVYRSQSAVYLSEITKLEIFLRFNKIPHVFLKGVLVSLRYEGSIPKRIYADCDILVHKNEFKRIKKIFDVLGYMPLSPPPSLTKAKRLADQPEVSFMKMVGKIPVIFDVHFEPVFLMRWDAMNLLYSKKMLINLATDLIRRGERRKIQGCTYSLCSVSDQILYLALHIFHHNYTGSFRYQLLDAVIRRGLLRLPTGRQVVSSPRNDMKELVRTIKEYRLEGYVYGVFILLKKYYKTPIPSSFLLTISPSCYPTSPFLLDWLRGASTLQIIKYIVRHVDIFSQESRGKERIVRFILVFLLSPESMVKKILFFIHPDIFRTIFSIFRSLFDVKTLQNTSQKPRPSSAEYAYGGSDKA